MNTYLFHQPVMEKEVLYYLLWRKDGVYVDATVGGGGHALSLLSQLEEGAVLIGIDRDEEAIKMAEKTLQHSPLPVYLVRGNFSQIDQILLSLGTEQVSGILFDLGVSSWQLDEAERGFSFQKEGPLDMRMDLSQKQDAYQVVNKLSEKELADLIYYYGEERFSRKIAQAIVRERERKPIATTRELAQIIERVVPQREKIHPATRTFMALRIFVNEELKEIEEALEKVSSMVEEGGRVVVISYHSLEDRIVKNFFRHREEWEILTKKPVRPTPQEVKDNPRARSGRLRAAKRRG
ncbi:MAG TPA: 16S rRNA (cytosine(1402)-N(4))-methyltransferase RsmH [Candidatus Atribacteria bacterium]|nr:16S rRNA (cytosine(1402)-N(4))-methyltransferase RsmH [Candidatus Atribacteria bacterium]